MTKDEALKLALQALEKMESYEAMDTAITAIKEALAQPEHIEQALNMVEKPEQHRFFCSRCGKRLRLEPSVHTCTPPRTFDDYGHKIV